MNIYGMILLIALGEFFILVLLMSKFTSVLNNKDDIEKENEKLRSVVEDLRLEKFIDDIERNPYYSSL
ncbi:MAG: hypothetical protein K9G65_06135 [Rickettsiaceae bacterium]|nr:hypothetical protein [Rickettsiaceae bacterium]